MLLCSRCNDRALAQVEQVCAGVHCTLYTVQYMQCSAKNGCRPVGPGGKKKLKIEHSVLMPQMDGSLAEFRTIRSGWFTSDALSLDLSKDKEEFPQS